jgi:fructose-1,6-bisphosphatase I
MDICPNSTFYLVQVHHVVGDEEGEAKELVFDESENYVAVFDTLNGSSNIDAGIPTGTIIGIYQHDETCPAQEECVGLGPECSEDQARCLANTLQPRKNMVAAAYCLYSSSTSFVLTLGAGVYMFVLDDQIGEFVLSRPNLTIPETSSIMSFNEASLEKWDKPMQVVVKGWRNGTGQSGKQFSSRYIGSMVADVHRTLLHGGVFGYPADSMYANGKLHLLYEVAPMAFLVEQAGGIATTGTQRVMSILPEVIHQRTPIIMGSKNDVQELIDAYSEWSK